MGDVPGSGEPFWGRGGEGGGLGEVGGGCGGAEGDWLVWGLGGHDDRLLYYWMVLNGKEDM